MQATANNNEFHRPMVSIGMTVYNQEKYVARAIESILMQQVNFDYEIVIAEDCSTDRSREIVIEYAQKYPEVIRLILQEKNVGLKAQSICLKKACRGIYRAQLEGDDYLVDPYKLQKQVDFLESNPDFIAVSGRIECVNPNNKLCAFPYGQLTGTYVFGEEYTIEHFQQWLLPSHTGALLFRNVFYNCDPDWFETYEAVDAVGDRKTALMLVAQGRIYVMPDVVSVRRIDLGSAANFTSNSVKVKPYATICMWMDNLQAMAKDMYDIDIDFSNERRKQWIYSLKNFSRNPNKNNLQVVKKVYKTSKEKGKYCSLALVELREKVSVKIKREGFLCAFGGMVRFCFSSVKKLLKSKRSNVSSSMSIIASNSVAIKNKSK